MRRTTALHRVITTALVLILPAALILFPNHVTATGEGVGDVVYMTLGEEGLKAILSPPDDREIDIDLDAQNGGSDTPPLEGGAQGGTGSKDGMKTLVANGYNAFDMEFKHQAALLRMKNNSGIFFFTCGGSILSERHVLTAAHCVDDPEYDYFVIVGLHNLSMGLSNPGAQFVPVSKVKIHPKYGPGKDGYPNDIAILKLQSDIVNSSYVEYAVLAPPDAGDFEGESCIVSGYGRTSASGPLADTLQFGYQYITGLRDCRNFWAVSKSARITNRHICGYYYPVSACFGDSGGPLSCGQYVVGVMSWLLFNCSGCFPSIYTRVSFYYNWIQQVMAQG